MAHNRDPPYEPVDDTAAVGQRAGQRATLVTALCTELHLDRGQLRDLSTTDLNNLADRYYNTPYITEVPPPATRLSVRCFTDTLLFVPDLSTRVIRV